jgi:hypothetical protein
LTTQRGWVILLARLRRWTVSLFINHSP